MKKRVSFIILLSAITSVCAASLVTVPDKLMTCASCHGEQGKAANPAWPNLAGQHEKYMMKRLKDYKANKTGSTTPMTGITAMLSEQDFLALSSYYAQKPPISGEAEEQYVKQGEKLYRGGDFERKIAACIACHGPQGKGNNEAGFPRLSGQNAAYTIAQLEAFQAKTRTDDKNGIMRDIASKMSKEDMVAVAHYIQGLY